MKIGRDVPISRVMPSLGKRVEPPVQAASDIEARFLAVNQDKLRRLHDNLTSRQRDLVEALPVLFHANQRGLPGFVSNDTPAGVSEYAPGRQAMKALQRLAPSVDYDRQPKERPRIKGLYLMGSPGTVAFSRSSDLDVWLVHDPDLDEGECASLAQKAEKVERFAATLDLEMHFFVFDAASFRAGSTLNLSEESSGSSQHHLLLDEFYRSGLLLAGLKPLWWRVPPDDEHRYDEVTTADFVSGAASADDYVDFGGLTHIPADEFFGVALWHLYKSIDSPYKSLLKLLLMETYATEYPDGQLLSHRYKDAVYSGDLSLVDLDPYIAMYRKVEEYLSVTNDEPRLELTRRSFYLKTNIPCSRQRDAKTPDWQFGAVQDLVRDWDWKPREISHLDNRHDWKIAHAAEERRVLIKALGRSYATLSKFARQHGRNQKITQTDLNVLGRKLYAAFERKPSKVDIITRGICPNPIEQELSLHAEYAQGREPKWKLYRGNVSPDQVP